VSRLHPALKLLVCLCLLGAGACAPAPQPDIVIPTLMLLPSATPTQSEPTATVESAEVAVLPTSTALPTEMPTVEVVALVEGAELAALPTLAVLPSLTPTATVTATLPPTLTPSPTPTSAPTSTSVPPTLLPPAVQPAANALASFSGAGAGTAGSVTLPEGIYTARVTTRGSFTALLEVESGGCGVGSLTFLAPMLFSFAEGEGVNGAEATVNSMTCSARVVVSDASADWTLTFSAAG
jgi:hypothetical protein